MSLVSIYGVFSSPEEAERLGRLAVEEKLAACVNILGPIRSIYRWKGEIETSVEVAAIFKTTSGRADRLIARMVELHSYEVPCIAAWPIEHIPASYASFVEEGVADPT